MDNKRIIFVFGSNTRGRHGKGAALTAKHKYGAKEGIGEGLKGFSYAIPTREFVGGKIETLELEDIRTNVQRFIRFAVRHPEMRFLITRIGTGYAGYTDDDIAPLFWNAPANCIIPYQWDKYTAINLATHDEGKPYI